MICATTQKWLSAYLDRQLFANEKTAVAAHLQDCSRCAEELESLVQIKRRLRTLAQPSMPEAVRAAIEAETILQRPWWTALHLQWWVPSLAFAAFAAWFTLHSYRVRNPVAIQPQLEARQTSSPKHDEVAWHPATPLSHDTQ